MWCWCPTAKQRYVEDSIINVSGHLIEFILPQTTTNKDGSLSFDCQHGPIECDGNRIHACVVDVIVEQHLQVEMASCMIQNNIVPRDAFHRVSDGR